MSGIVTAIYTAPHSGAGMVKSDEAEMVAGRGIVGDRYYADAGTFSEKLKGLPDHELTLIGLEEIENFNQTVGLSLAHGVLRRNLITSGIYLNSLVGLEFTIGQLRFKGVRLCEPCAHLAKLVVPEVLPHLVGRGGLRAAILESGKIRRGDRIEVCEP